MVKAKNFLIIFFLLTISCGVQNQDSEEIKLIQSTFARYNSAILNDKGEEAVNYVDSRTIKYYDDTLEKVKTADKDAVNSLTFMDKFLVLMIRHRAKKEEILSFDGRKLFVYSINNGMVGKNNVPNNSIGEVKIEENFAKGQLVVKGQKIPFYLHFYKEENKWKIDLTSLFSMTAMAFKKLVDDSKMTENEYIFELLETVSNKKVGEEIWIPTEKLKP